MDTVKLDRWLDQAVAKPMSFLGPGPFNLYRKACEGAGARYLKGAEGHVIGVDHVPALKAALQAAGFNVYTHGPLVELARARASSVRKTHAQTLGRLEYVKARAKEANKALFPFQEEGAAWLAPAVCALLGDEPGLGKTAQALAAIPEVSPVLVVGPAVAKGVWCRETSTFRPDLVAHSLSGRGSFRWPLAGELIATNYDILPRTRLEAERAEDQSWEDPDQTCPEGIILIADECHTLGSNKTLRTARWRELRSIALGHGGKVWGLTGTIMLNRPIQLWNALTSLGLQREAFGSWTNFIRMFAAKQNHWGAYEFPTDEELRKLGKTRADEEIAASLRKVMLRRLRKTVAPQLPEKRWSPVDVDLPKAAMKQLDAVSAELEASGIGLRAAMARAMMSQDSQVKFGELSKAWADLARAMIPTMLEWVESMEEQNEPVLVFSAHTDPVAALGSREGWACITGDTSAAERTRLQNEFQAGALRGLALGIQAGGVALTLTRAALALFVDLEWTPALNEQAADRMVRHGQTRGVVCYYLQPNHELVRQKNALLLEKAGLIANTVDAAAVEKASPKVDADALEKL